MSGFIQGILGLLGANIDIQVPEKAGWSQRFARYFEHLKLFAGELVKWIDGISDDMREAYKRSAELAPFITAVLGILGADLAVTLPKGDRFEWALSIMDYMSSVVFAVGKIGLALSKIDETTKTLITEAAKIAGDIQTVLGILGIELQAEFAKIEDRFNWALGLMEFVSDLKWAAGQVGKRLAGIDEETKTLITKAAAIAGDIGTVLSVLGFSLAVEKPGKDFRAVLTAHLDAMDMALEMVLPRLKLLKEKWTKKGLAAFAEVADSIQSVLGILGIDFWRGGEGLGFADSAQQLQEELGWLLDDIAMATDMIMDPTSGLPAIWAKWGDALANATKIADAIKSVFDAIIGAMESGAEALKQGLDIQALRRLLDDFRQVAIAAAAIGMISMPGAPVGPAPLAAMPPAPYMAGGGQGGPAAGGPQALEIDLYLTIDSPELQGVFDLVDSHITARSRSGEHVAIRLRPNANAKSV